MLHRDTARHVRHHISRAVRTASNVTAALTPGYRKFVHPVLDALPETRPYARAINNAMAINSTARNLGSAYENIRSAIRYMAAEEGSPLPDLPDVPEDVPEEVPEVPEVPEEGSPRDVPPEAPPPAQPKRGRGRPRKDPSAPPKPKKQAVVPDARPAQREEPRSEVDNILYLFKQREIEEQRRKSEQYRVMLGL